MLNVEGHTWDQVPEGRLFESAKIQWLRVKSVQIQANSEA